MANYMKVYTLKDIHMNENDEWVDEDNIVITGLKRTFYGDGSIQDETPIFDGRINGVQRVYDQTGSVWYENTWKSNRMVKFKKYN